MPAGQLGHRMLDLQAGVHLQEDELSLAVAARLHETFDGARVDVADRDARRVPPRRRAGAQLVGPTAGDGVSSAIFWWRR